MVMHHGHDCYGSLAWCVTTVKHDLDVGECRCLFMVIEISINRKPVMCNFVCVRVCTFFLPRDAMQARSMLSCGVCLSVTFADHVKTNKHIFEFFFAIG